MTADPGPTNNKRGRLREPPGDQLEQTIQRLRHGLAECDTPQSMSSNAVAVLRQRLQEYTEQVGSEAIRIAKRNRADAVSGADVEEADRKLRGASLPARRALANMVGPATFGAGLSEFITVMTAARPERLGIGLGCAGMVGGLVGIAYGLVQGR